MFQNPSADRRRPWGTAELCQIVAGGDLIGGGRGSDYLDGGDDEDQLFSHETGGGEPWFVSRVETEDDGADDILLGRSGTDGSSISWTSWSLLQTKNRCRETLMMTNSELGDLRDARVSNRRQGATQHVSRARKGGAFDALVDGAVPVYGLPERGHTGESLAAFDRIVGRFGGSVLVA
ncbi:MAG: hypothetical protein AB8B91_06680 [Rubripirellula sp.]